jgi:hypothetical protein
VQVPHQPSRILGLFRRCGFIRDAAALCALLGFLFTAAAPGLSMAAFSDAGLGGVYICHAQGSGPAASLPGQEQSSDDEGCCLLCQAAQLAHNAAPPQHFTLSAESAGVVRFAIADQAPVLDRFSGHAQARAPPAA